MPDEKDPAGPDARSDESSAPASPAAKETTDDEGRGQDSKRRGGKRQGAITTPPIILSASGIPMVQGVDAGAGPGGAAGGWAILPPPRDPASGPWGLTAPTLTDRDQSGSSSDDSEVDDIDLDVDGTDDTDDLDDAVEDGSAARGGEEAGVKVTGRSSGTDHGDDDLDEDDDGLDPADLDESDFDEPDFDEDDEDEDEASDGGEGSSPSWQKNISGERPRRREIAPEVKVAAFGILAALLLTVGAIALSKSLGGSSSDDTASVTPEATASVKPPATSKVGDCVYTEDEQTPARDVTLPPAGSSVDTNPAKMVITTNLGTMTATLDAAKAPCTVHALSYLAGKKYFDGTTCHRETSGPDAGIYVLQCGDPTGTGGGSPGFQYKNENTTGVNYNRGVIAMANAGPDTNGSQFFINYADPSEEGAQALAGNYTVVGQITEGLDVLDKITGPGAAGETGDGEPVTKPQILSFTITQ
ncbi:MULTISPECIES: peptidylprolyl isomerase [Pseudofrankia]|uniref:peptidylprolyl isomerase n=1 Tax=Pseudofrankia TaxID=2994363 RepID=UPI000234BEC0